VFVISTTSYKFNERRQHIYKLIIEGMYRNQKEVIDALKKMGHFYNQSDVSKDFKILGVERTPDGFLFIPEKNNEGFEQDLTDFYRAAVNKSEYLTETKVCSINTKKGHSKLLGEKIEKYNISSSNFNIKLLPLPDSLLIFYEEDTFFENLKNLLNVHDTLYSDDFKNSPTL